jgi:DNA mismatch endonuclease, patch repair protein
VADIMSKGQRSELMSRVQSSDTRPEWILRSALHRLGFRFRLKNNHLPGRPDLVFPKYRTAVFVHGCFWHCHDECKKASVPKTNHKFWVNKLKENVSRDIRTLSSLTEQGWRVLVVWECQLEDNTLETIRKTEKAIRGKSVSASCSESKQAKLERTDLLAVADKKVQWRLRKGRNGKV